MKNHINDPEGNPCGDCGEQTTPGDGGPESDGRWEWYMVRNPVWLDAITDELADGKMPPRWLCIPCLEMRLNRFLGPQDFALVPVNVPSRLDSQTLALRKLSVREAYINHHAQQGEDLDAPST